MGMADKVLKEKITRARSLINDLLSNENSSLNSDDESLKKIDKLFEKIDTNKSGLISKNEFRDFKLANKKKRSIKVVNKPDNSNTSEINKVRNILNRLTKKMSEKI